MQDPIKDHIFCFLLKREIKRESTSKELNPLNPRKYFSSDVGDSLETNFFFLLNKMPNLSQIIYCSFTFSVYTQNVELHITIIADSLTRSIDFYNAWKEPLYT